jgi:hypothetical protein
MFGVWLLHVDLRKRPTGSQFACPVPLSFVFLPPRLKMSTVGEGGGNLFRGVPSTPLTLIEVPVEASTRGRYNIGMDEVCQECGKPISRRAKANVWNGERVVCTECLHKLEDQVRRGQAAIRLAGVARAPWLVHDGRKQWGPYPTAQLMNLLRTKQVDWMWNVWREGMGKWVPAAQLFTMPKLSNGKVELRDHRQGDGTYRFRP